MTIVISCQFRIHRTNEFNLKTKAMKQPILLVDSHYGIYSFQLLIETLNDEIKQQIPQRIIDDLSAGPDNENYWGAANDLENLSLKWENEKWQVTSNEDLWLVPESFMQSEEIEDWYI